MQGRIILALAATLGACTSAPRVAVTALPHVEDRIAESRHDGSDDLVSAGLGLDGLAQLVPPPEAPLDPTGQRRRTVAQNWRGIADLRAAAWPEPLPHVPGREFSARLRLPGDTRLHKVLMQLPDAFDAQRPCLVIAPASGSRGVYGAIAVAAPVALPRGCAVVYTDKGAGTGFEATADGGVYVPHAHSGDNPESRWGEHVLAAARFGLSMLDRAGLRREPFTPGNTRVIAVGVSNGGGAVLRAAEIDREQLIDAVVAAAPNVRPRWTDARPLYDFATEAALYQPCLLAHPDWLDAPFVTAALRREGQQRCALLRSAGLLSAATAVGQAREALDRLRVSGWDPAALRLAGQNVAFDLWRSIAVTYASGYGRYAPGQHPCGFSFAQVDAAGRPREASALERQLWRTDGTGIPPTAGVAMIDPNFRGDDATLPGLACLRRLWSEDTPDGRRVRAGIDAVEANGRPLSAAVTILHGSDDALIPAAFTSRPYVAAARAHGREVTYVEVPRAQHFDAFLPLPAMQGYEPLLPHVHRALAAAIDQR